MTDPTATINSAPSGKLFVSHTHADVDIAKALDVAVTSLLGPRTIEVVYSTKKGPGGILPGEDWYAWIVRQVRESRVALVLFTPTSVHKPWLYWEAGAVYGSALADGSGDTRRVRPVLYGLRRDDVPTTFPTTQAVRGDDRADMDALLTGLFDDFESILGRHVVVDAVRRLPTVLERYLASVEVALRQAPLAPTEETVQEWCTRLDLLSEGDRASEVRHVHRWLDVAFGTTGTAAPIDLRIHRRLGELYLGIRQYRQAAEQFTLARRLVPRDIFVLRALGQALLGCGDLGGTEEVLHTIAAFDPEAFAVNVECAALRGRWLLQQGRQAEAEGIYATALSQNSDSYYIADLLGQVRLELGDRDGARDAYRQALATIDRLSEDNIWVEATAATAAIVVGDTTRALDHLRRVRELQPTQENLDSIERGLRRCQQALALSENSFTEWQEALRS